MYEAVTFYEPGCIYLLPETAAKSTPAIFIFLGPHQIEAITLFCPTLQCNLCLTSITLNSNYYFWFDGEMSVEAKNSSLNSAPAPLHDSSS